MRVYVIFLAPDPSNTPKVFSMIEAEMLFCLHRPVCTLCQICYLHHFVIHKLMPPHAIDSFLCESRLSLSSAKANARGYELQSGHSALEVGHGNVGAFWSRRDFIVRSNGVTFFHIIIISSRGGVVLSRLGRLAAEAVSPRSSGRLLATALADGRTPAPMAVFNQERAPTVYTVFGNAEEEVLGVHVLIDQMHPALLWGPAFPIAPFHKAGVLLLPKLANISHCSQYIKGMDLLTVCSPFSLSTAAKASCCSSM